MRLPPLLLAAGLALALTGAAARADVAKAVNQVILPDTAAFADAAAALSAKAQESCDPAALRPTYDAAFDAWMRIQHLKFGPIEEAARGMAVNFWPDPKSKGAKAQAALIAAQDASVLAPEAFAQVPMAARGFPGLERLLTAPEPPQGFACDLTRATAADLARLGAEIRDGWTGGFATALTAPGAGGPYLTETEARQALLTQLVIGVDRLGDDRLGRPLGTFHKPRPERAEAAASGRSLRNVQQALIGLRALAAALVADAPQTMAAFDRADRLAADLDDPVLAGVADPSGRLKVEILQQALHAVRDAAMSEMAAAMGVTLGFNAADGD